MLPPGVVAVAVTLLPTLDATWRTTLKFPVPAWPVVTVVRPTNTFPSPLPLGSQEGLERNSTR